MADVEDTRALLVMAVQDLGDAEAAMVERLPQVRENLRDNELRQVVEEDEQHSAAQRETLAAIARELGAAARDQRNIWLRAILDDADNDARSIAPGALLDIALAGALRKAKQSERVSYETAIALAERLGLEGAAQVMTEIRDTEQATDAALAQAQKRICAGA